MALRLSGRFMISQVMPLSFSMSTVSYFLLAIVVSLPRSIGVAPSGYSAATLGSSKPR